MTDEGVRLVSRLALLALLVVVTAVFRTMIGPSRRRGEIAALGTVGGFALGVFAAAPLSRWAGADVSAIAACIGVFIGWAIIWPFARRLPREESRNRV